MSLRKIIVFHPGAARLGNRFRFTEMTTKIWIEQLRHPDGRPRYSSRGQLYRTRLGGPDGEVLCEQTVSPVCPSCRVLLARGITGPFETWKRRRALCLHARRYREGSRADRQGAG